MNARIGLARPAFAFAVALAVAACGGADAVSTTTADGDVTPATTGIVVEPAEGESAVVDADSDPDSEADSDPEIDSGSEPDSSAADPATSATNGLSAADAAAVNEPNLQPADDARDIEVLSVVDGSITTLRDAAAGDRPVLLWFWAPH